jgi:ribosomal protein L11 methyltransferase
LDRREISLQIASADVPVATALLELAGADSIALRDAADTPLYEPQPSETPLWPVVEVRALFASHVDFERLKSVLEDACESAVGLRMQTIADRDWRAAAAQGFTARRFGSRLWLLPADEQRVPEDATVVRLHMGLAFGTGEHPTTALCLEWLDASLRPGTRVLDYGCGSGVLAIAALALGASRAWAIDNDPQALMATRQNAQLNGCEHALFVGPPGSLPPLRVDVVLANILAGPLIALADTFAHAVVAGGKVVLSGILTWQAAEVAAAYEAHFEHLSSQERDGWSRLECVRRPE